MDMIRWEPGGDLPRLRDEVNRLFDLPFRLFGRENPWAPSIDVYETEGDVVVKAELPGIAPGDIDVRVTEDSLSIRGETKEDREERKEGYYRRERRAGSIYRVVPLPTAVRADEARASFRHGILEVRVPKADEGQHRGYRLRVEEQQ